jgi:hypothetical protein
MKAAKHEFIIARSLPDADNTLITVPALFAIRYPISRMVENILRHGRRRGPCPMIIE